MEDSGILDRNNPINIKVFHFLYEKQIQRDLGDWAGAYHNHCVRAEYNKTSLQLWHSGCSQNVSKVVQSWTTYTKETNQQMLQ